jgi:16S rRNA (adenine(1408)-N(1))-methyltransferase
MKLVVGNNQKELTKEELEELVSKYSSVLVDLGTGDGRFVYKKALSNPNTLFIGIDPSEKQLQIYSKKALRSKLKNALFIVGSIENIPIETESIAHEININLPWGTLLESIVKPTKEIISKLSKLLKVGGEINITLGYTPELEPSETRRLDLPVIGNELIEDTITPLFKSCDLALKRARELDKKELKDIETTWAKKLNFGKDRKIYNIIFKKVL